MKKIKRLKVNRISEADFKTLRLAGCEGGWYWVVNLTTPCMMCIGSDKNVTLVATKEYIDLSYSFPPMFTDPSVKVHFED